MVFRLFPVLWLAVAAFLMPGPAGAAEQSPRNLVEGMNATLIQVMREADTLGYQGRYDRLAPVLMETFNFPLMASISVGREWRKLDEAQREILIAVFGRVSIATFAARFNGFNGERFQIISEDKAPRNSILVRNRLIKADGEAVEINYLLRSVQDEWRVVDVYLDGKYSELAIKRSEYGSVIKNQGFESLIRDLNEKIAELAADN